ncbi:hypothetical protein QUA62_20140 [Microcoleus sp. MON1_C1]|uniref:hypothetical protein n=1 Tax=Microcoleus sp. MON1_C1 TaxID=2818827 RepID=UPI002FD347BD
MVARLIRLLGWRGEGAIDTTMPSDKQIGSANRWRGDVRSNAPTHLAELFVSKPIAFSSELVEDGMPRSPASRQTMNQQQRLTCATSNLVHFTSHSVSR